MNWVKYDFFAQTCEYISRETEGHGHSLWSIGLHCSLYSTEREGENNANNQMAINARAESGIGQINLLRKVKNVSL